MTLSTGVSTGAAGDIKIRPHDSNSVDVGGNIHISGGANKKGRGSLVSIESGSSDKKTTGRIQLGVPSPMQVILSRHIFR